MKLIALDSSRHLQRARLIGNLIVAGLIWYMVADGSQNGAIDNIVKSGFGEFWSPGRISVAFRRWAMGRGRGLGLGRAWAGPGLGLGCCWAGGPWAWAGPGRPGRRRI